MEAAIQLILASPEFLFRFEPIRPPRPVGAIHRLSDLELASRLSFFLWSSVPDDQLINLASAGKLKDPAVLDQQIKRMLADRRSAALVNNFVGQWLLLRNLKSINPDFETFPDFDDNLRQAMRRDRALLRQHRAGKIARARLLNANYVRERALGKAQDRGIWCRLPAHPINDERRRGCWGVCVLRTPTGPHLAARRWVV